jgi:hypothetical protein
MLSLWLIKYHAVKTYPLLNHAPRHEYIYICVCVCEEVEVWLHTFLTSALDRDKWLASLSGRFTPPYPLGSRLSGPWRGWRREKNPCSCQESNRVCPVRSLIPLLTELSRLQNIKHPPKQQPARCSSYNFSFWCPFALRYGAEVGHSSR